MEEEKTQQKVDITSIERPWKKTTEKKKSKALKKIEKTKDAIVSKKKEKILKELLWIWKSLHMKTVLPVHEFLMKVNQKKGDKYDTEFLHSTSLKSSEVARLAKEAGVNITSGQYDLDQMLHLYQVRDSISTSIDKAFKFTVILVYNLEDFKKIIEFEKIYVLVVKTLLAAFASNGDKGMLENLGRLQNDPIPVLVTLIEAKLLNIHISPIVGMASDTGNEIALKTADGTTKIEKGEAGLTYKRLMHNSSSKEESLKNLQFLESVRSMFPARLNAKFEASVKNSRTPNLGGFGLDYLNKLNGFRTDAMLQEEYAKWKHAFLGSHKLLTDNNTVAREYEEGVPETKFFNVVKTSDTLEEAFTKYKKENPGFNKRITNKEDLVHKLKILSINNTSLLYAIDKTFNPDDVFSGVLTPSEIGVAKMMGNSVHDTSTLSSYIRSTFDDDDEKATKRTTDALNLTNEKDLPRALIEKSMLAMTNAVMNGETDFNQSMGIIQKLIEWQKSSDKTNKLEELRIQNELEKHKKEIAALEAKEKREIEQQQKEINRDKAKADLEKKKLEIESTRLENERNRMELENEKAERDLKFKEQKELRESNRETKKWDIETRRAELESARIQNELEKHKKEMAVLEAKERNATREERKEIDREKARMTIETKKLEIESTRLENERNRMELEKEKAMQAEKRAVAKETREEARETRSHHLHLEQMANEKSKLELEKRRLDSSEKRALAKEAREELHNIREHELYKARLDIEGSKYNKSLEDKKRDADINEQNLALLQLRVERERNQNKEHNLEEGTRAYERSTRNNRAKLDKLKHELALDTFEEMRINDQNGALLDTIKKDLLNIDERSGRIENLKEDILRLQRDDTAGLNEKAKLERELKMKELNDEIRKYDSIASGLLRKLEDKIKAVKTENSLKRVQNMGTAIEVEDIELKNQLSILNNAAAFILHGKIAQHQLDYETTNLQLQQTRNEMSEIPTKQLRSSSDLVKERATNVILQILSEQFSKEIQSNPEKALDIIDKMDSLTGRGTLKRSSASKPKQITQKTKRDLSVTIDNLKTIRKKIATALKQDEQMSDDDLPIIKRINEQIGLIEKNNEVPLGHKQFEDALTRIANLEDKSLTEAVEKHLTVQNENAKVVDDYNDAWNKLHDLSDEMTYDTSLMSNEAISKRGELLEKAYSVLNTDYTPSKETIKVLTNAYDRLSKEFSTLSSKDLTLHTELGQIKREGEALYSDLKRSLVDENNNVNQTGKIFNDPVERSYNDLKKATNKESAERALISLRDLRKRIEKAVTDILDRKQRDAAALETHNEKKEEVFKKFKAFESRTDDLLKRANNDSRLLDVKKNISDSLEVLKGPSLASTKLEFIENQLPGMQKALKDVDDDIYAIDNVLIPDRNAALLSLTEEIDHVKKNVSEFNVGDWENSLENYKTHVPTTKFDLEADTKHIRSAKERLKREAGKFSITQRRIQTEKHEAARLLNEKADNLKIKMGGYAEDDQMKALLAQVKSGAVDYDEAVRRANEYQKNVRETIETSHKKLIFEEEVKAISQLADSVYIDDAFKISNFILEKDKTGDDIRKGFFKAKSDFESRNIRRGAIDAIYRGIGEDRKMYENEFEHLRKLGTSDAQEKANKIAQQAGSRKSKQNIKKDDLQTSIDELKSKAISLITALGIQGDQLTSIMNYKSPNLIKESLEVMIFKLESDLKEKEKKDATNNQIDRVNLLNLSKQNNIQELANLRAKILQNKQTASEEYNEKRNIRKREEEDKSDERKAKKQKEAMDFMKEKFQALNHQEKLKFQTQQVKDLWQGLDHNQKMEFFRRYRADNHDPNSEPVVEEVDMEIENDQSMNDMIGLMYYLDYQKSNMQKTIEGSVSNPPAQQMNISEIPANVPPSTSLEPSRGSIFNQIPANVPPSTSLEPSRGSIFNQIPANTPPSTSLEQLSRGSIFNQIPAKSTFARVPLSEESKESKESKKRKQEEEPYEDVSKVQRTSEEKAMSTDILESSDVLMIDEDALKQFYDDERYNNLLGFDQITKIAEGIPEFEDKVQFFYELKNEVDNSIGTQLKTEMIRRINPQKVDSPETLVNEYTFKNMGSIIEDAKNIGIEKSVERHVNIIINTAPKKRTDPGKKTGTNTTPKQLSKRGQKKK